MRENILIWFELIIKRDESDVSKNNDVNKYRRQKKVIRCDLEWFKDNRLKRNKESG